MNNAWAVLFVDQAACLFAACLFAATFIGANVVPACNALVELAYPKLCCNYVAVDCPGCICVSPVWVAFPYLACAAAGDPPMGTRVVNVAMSMFLACCSVEALQAARHALVDGPIF